MAIVRRAIVPIFAGLVACSAVLDTERQQCATDEQCRGRGGLSPAAMCAAHVCVEAPPTPKVDAGVVEAAPPDPVWGCLETKALPVEDETVPVVVKQRFVGMLNSTPVPGVTVKVCKADDTTCAQPREGATTISSDSGEVELPLYAGFRGYLDVSRAETQTNPMPGLVYLPALDKNVPLPAITNPQPLLNASDLDFLAGSIRMPTNPAYGHAIVGVLDCQGINARDILIRPEQLTNETASWYSDDTLAPSATQEHTSTSGVGGAVNLPPGLVTFQVTRTNGQRIGEWSFLIRAASMTYTYVGPGL